MNNYGSRTNLFNRFTCTNHRTLNCREKSVTLVVARCEKGRIAIAADTLLSAHESALPLTAGALKSCCLPGYLCVSYAGSPDLAAKAFWEFEQTYPRGTTYDATVSFFEQSSSRTRNDYILAFGAIAKLVTVKDGRRVQTISKTHWIGDKHGFEKFREYEHRRRNRYEHGRAINAAMFADEMKGSPASDLHGVMRNVVLDPTVSGVGGFVTVLANRDVGFRYSAYSDILLDWPEGLAQSRSLQLGDKFDLVASGENDRYSISQISPGYYNMNAVAFYLLKGRLLIVLLGCNGGLPGQFITFSDVEPATIAATLDEKLGFNFGALCMVMSSREGFSSPHQRTNPDDGIALSLYCEANTFPKPQPISHPS
jgi:hypothetical protein